MKILGNTQINELFLKFHLAELTYKKTISAALGLRPGSSSLRIFGQTHPCVIHSMSFSAARVILKVPSTLLEELRTGSRLGVLKMSFQGGLSSSVEDFTFSGKFHLQSHQNTPDGTLLFLLRLDFTHRPPEGFIEIQGNYLKLKADAEHRKDQRLTVDDETLRIMGLASSKGEMFIEKIPRRCVVREVSFGGATIILGGVAKFLWDKNIQLNLEMIKGGPLVLPGKIVRAVPLEGYKAMAVLGLTYQEDQVPGEYLKAVQKGLNAEGPTKPRKTSTKTPLVGAVDTKNFTIKKG